MTFSWLSGIMMRPLIAATTSLFVLAMIVGQDSQAQEASLASSPAHQTGKNNHDESGYLTFFLDNDLFAGDDSNYTNGARLSYITEGKPAINIPFMQENLRLFSGAKDSVGWMQKIWGFRQPSEIEYHYGFALTQLMFTPETREALVPPPGERPYAGWLGVGFSLHAHDKYVLNSVEITLGTVGPHALGQESQDLIHDIRNLKKFKGWDSQIPNEPTLNIFFNQKRRWDLLEEAELPFDLEIDGFHETGYAVGNLLTDIHVGGVIRIGWNLPVEFSDPRLTQTAHTQRLYLGGEEENEHDWSGYALFGARGAAIFHDITLDGPVFRNYDTGVSKERFVGEIYAGFGVRYRDWECGYVHTYRTKQYKSQADPQWFGTVTIRKRF